MKHAPHFAAFPCFQLLNVFWRHLVFDGAPVGSIFRISGGIFGIKSYSLSTRDDNYKITYGIEAIFEK